MPPSKRDQEPGAEVAKLCAAFHLHVPAAQREPGVPADVPALHTEVCCVLPRAVRDHSPSALQEAQREAEHDAELPAL